MVLDQNLAHSSQDESNPSSTSPATWTLGDNSAPTITANCRPLSESDIASLSHLNPLDPPRLSIPDHSAVHGSASSNHHSPIDENDTVIAVMGLTGAGKSSFINTAAGRAEIVIVNNLRTQTCAMQSVRCIHPNGRRNIVLVDTPGFNATHLSDAQTLRIIANWLKETYQNNIKLAGLLYLHRISDVRMVGAPLRNLSAFKDLCGDSNLKNVVLVTTMWDEVQDESVGSKTEAELFADAWKDMICLGSHTCRFQSTRESAWEIINCLDLEGSHQKGTALQIQREMVDRGLPLHETTAAKTLISSTAKFAGERKRVLMNARNQASQKASPRESSSGLSSRAVLNRFSTTTSSAYKIRLDMIRSTSTLTFVSCDSTSSSSPAESTSSDCSPPLPRVTPRDCS